MICSFVKYYRVWALRVAKKYLNVEGFEWRQMILDAGGGIDLSIPRIGLSRPTIVNTSHTLLVKVVRVRIVWGSRLTAPRYSRQESREGVKKVRKERKDQEIFTWLEKGKDNWAKWRAVSCRHSNFDTRRREKSTKRRLRSRETTERKVVCHCSLCQLFSSEYRIEGSPSTLNEILREKGTDPR